MSGPVIYLVGSRKVRTPQIDVVFDEPLDRGQVLDALADWLVDELRVRPGMLIRVREPDEHPVPVGRLH